MKKQSLVLLSVLAVFGLLLVVACAPAPTPPPPQVVKETVVVQQTVAVPVPQTVVAEKVITATPAPASAKKITVGYTPISDPVDAGRLNLDNGVGQGIKEAGGLMMYCSPSPRGGAVGDPSVQAACVDTFIAAKVDGILLFPTDVEAMIPSIKKANDAKIPVFLWDTALRDNAGVVVVMGQGNPDRVGGQKNGEAMVAALTKKYGSPKGLVLEVQGSMKTSAGVNRGGGFHDVIDKYPDIKVVSKDGGWDMGKGATIMEDWLTANPGTDGLYLHSIAAYGGISILDDRGMWKKIGEKGHVILVGNDPSGPLLYAMKHGYVDYMYELGWQYPPLPFTRAMMKYLQTGIALKEGDKVETGVPGFGAATIVKVPGVVGLMFMSGTVVVTRENVGLAGLYGNAFMLPPNGISPESGAGLWKGDK